MSFLYVFDYIFFSNFFSFLSLIIIYYLKGDGEGEVIRDRDRCKKCKGVKTVEEKKILEIFIEKGMQNNQRIVMQGEADQEVFIWNSN